MTLTLTAESSQPTFPTLPAREIKCWNDVLVTPREMALIRHHVERDALPAEPPDDLMPAYRAAVYRLMCGDRSAWSKIHELRGVEHAQLGRR